jgi:hypothetical protein
VRPSCHETSGVGKGLRVLGTFGCPLNLLALIGGARGRDRQHRELRRDGSSVSRRQGARMCTQRSEAGAETVS